MLVGAGPARDVPSGTVSLLFSDIEGSALRWERHRDAMRAAVEQHDAILRSVIQRHGGYIFKTMGDAFCAAFSTAENAVAASVDAQRELRRADWSSVGDLRVRMAVHTGPVEARDGDYFGPAVNRVSRLLSIAYGGQIVVSGIAKELSEGALETAVSLRDLGAHRLRDLAQPEQVYQVVAEGLPDTFPPLRSLEALPNNLPLQLTPFIGRETEIAQIESAIKEARLITLVGAGGVGKTRLALQSGADLLDTFDDGVWFVDLALMREAEQVPRAIAEVANVRLELERDPLETIAAALRSKRLLLILDNCEHVVAAAARSADSILRACPGTRILATSRQALGIAAERVIRVPSLSLPEGDRRISATEARRYGAIALFTDRALAANGSFALDDENASTVAEICRRLDGIALALELAAPRLKALSVNQLAARLNERFRLLTGGSRTALPRQQTMRALIDWSYDLLDEREQTVFRRAAIFTGSFSLEAASDICADDTIDAWDLLDVLSSLVDKSMVVAELYGSEQRYRLLESTRQYALERLASTGEERELRRRHAAHFCRFTEEAEHRYFITPLRLWLSSVDPEVDNVRAALDWTIMDRGDVELGARTASAFVWYWIQSKQLAEAIERIEAAIEGMPDDGRIAARLWYGLAFLFNDMFHYERGRAAGQHALELAEKTGDAECIAFALVALASAAFVDETFDSEAAFTRALDIFSAAGNRRMVGVTLGRRARSLGVQGHLERARPIYDEALSISRSLGDDRTAAQILNNIAEATFHDGNAEAALRLAKESVEYGTAARMEGNLVSTYGNMCMYNLTLGNVGEALQNARKVLDVGRNVQNWAAIAFVSLHFAAIAAEHEQYESAAVLLGHFLPSMRTAYGGAKIEETEQTVYDRLLAILREHLGATRLAQLMSAGESLTRDELVERLLAVS